jgi:hypothetical protein
MQKSAITTAPTRASALTSRPSEERLSDAEYSMLATLFAQMMAAYPHQELGEAAEMYLRGFEILAVRHGLVRVKEAMQELLVTRRFFPHPSELAEVLNDMQTKERQQFLRDHPYVPCGKCDEGMVFVYADGSPYDWHQGGPRYVAECPCKREWRRQAARAFEAASSDGKTRAAGGA